jgi:replicative DNA helicase
VDAEMAVLGGVMISRAAQSRLADLLERGDFYLEAHRKVYDVVTYLTDHDLPADTQTVAEELRRRGQLDQIGGPLYLITLADACPTAAHVEYYAETVRTKSTLRKLLDAAAAITEMAHTQDLELPEIVERAETLVYQAGLKREAAGEWESVRTLALDALDRILEGKGTRGILTQYRHLDWMTGGWKPSRLYMLAGRPGSGKTAAALNFALTAAKAGVAVGFFSLEMEKGDLTNRLVAVESGLDGMRIEQGDLDAEERNLVSRTVGILGELPLHIYDRRNLTRATFRSQGLRAFRRHEIGLWVVDYLQLIRPEGRDRDDHRHYTNVAEDLKSFARETERPVIALSQLSRETERQGGSRGEKNRRPLLSHLRESGGLEQAADLVMMLYREAYYQRQESKELPGPDLTEFIIAKHRQGPTGTVKLWYVPESLRFEDMEQHRTPPPETGTHYALNGAGNE